jgi:CHAP domain
VNTKLSSEHEVHTRSLYRRWRSLLLLLFTSVMLASPALSQPASATAAFGTLLVPGNQWLIGQGVNAYWNNNQNPLTAPGSGYGTEWQCVELAQRLYYTRGWYGGTHFTGVQSAYQIYGLAGSLGMQAHANGSGVPVPGDMIVHQGTSAFPDGHVAVVDSVTPTAVNVVEQNASSTGRATYGLSGSTIQPRSGFGTILGYVHAPANHFTNATPAPSSKQVSVARRSDGTQDLFVRGNDGAAWFLGLDASGNVIHPWQSLGGSVLGAPSASWSTDGQHLDAYAVGADNQIYHDRYDVPNSGFNGWTLVSGGGHAASSTVEVARRSDNTQDLLVKGNDNAAWDMRLDSAGNFLRGWISLGGTVMGAPSGSWTSSGSHLDVYAVGSDSQIYRNSNDVPNSSFNGWVLVPGGGSAG